MSAADREPAGLIGQRVPRADSRRLMRGRGRYVADIALPRMLHLAFVRSPWAHARIRGTELAAARCHPGVAAVFTGAEFAAICEPLIGVARNRQGHKSAPQYPMAIDRVFWQGQPVIAVVAASRAEAEDAAEQVVVDWEPLPAIVDAEAALASALPIHPELADNLAFAHTILVGDPDKAFAEAAIVVERDFVFERQTGLTLEPRGIIADWNPGSESLTVHHSHQSPFQMQDVFSRHFGIPEHKVRVVTPDVGGGFGLKINVYAEELAAVAASRLLGRPVKFCADRLESFLSDGHSRDHRIKGRIAVTQDGRIAAMEIDDVSAIGAYGMALRFNIAEGMMSITSSGAPYAVANYRGRTRSVYVNKNLIGMYRGVGVPLAVAATELLTDLAATRLGIDPADFKRMNYRRTEEMPCMTVGGLRLDGCSFEACLDKLLAGMDYRALRTEQASLRQRGILRGIGIATFVEPSAYGPPYYGPTEARISVQDGCTIRLEPSGVLRCLTSITDQGQGTLTGLAQIIAETLGVPIERVEMVSGDSAVSPYGGGAWASRGMTVGGEAALKAARALKENILLLAASITQMVPADLDIKDGEVVARHDGRAVISLADVGRIGYFRQDTLPKDLNVELAVTRSHVANHQAYYTGNGVQGVHLEIDPETGFITLLGLWAVDDCGRVINPLIVDEQVRGGIVQGIGAALYEECIYDKDGNLLNGTMADYLAPMAAEMPDIHVDHIETRETTTHLGAKGIGEAGTIGAIGVIWVAVNDALKPLGASLCHQPFTPERVLDAIRAAARDASASLAPRTE